MHPQITLISQNFQRFEQASRYGSCGSAQNGTREEVSIILREVAGSHRIANKEHEKVYLQ